MALGLRPRIFIPLAGGIVLLLATFALLLVREQRRAMDLGAQRDLTATSTYLAGKLDTETRLMEAVLRTLAADEDLVRAFLADDASSLLRLTRGLFDDLRANHHITHLYFTRPDRTVLLRVHRPEQAEDTIPRATTLDALRTGELQAGLEIGRLRGLMTLRVVLPWVREGRLIGVIELGQEIDYFAHELKDVLGLDAFVLVPKSRVDRNAWMAGMEFMGRDADWDLLPDHIVSSGTLATVPEELRGARLAVQDQGAREIDIGGRAFRFGALPLRDRGGAEIGRLLVLRDQSGEVAAGKRALWAAIGLFLVVGLLLEGTLRRLVAHYYLQPLKDLQQVAARAGRGQLSETVTIQRPDELGELGRAINRMILDLRSANEAWERRLIEAAIDGVVALDEEGCVVMWNARAATILERRDRDLSGAEFAALTLFGEDAEAFRSALARFRSDHGASAYLEALHETAMRRGDGSSFDAEFSVTPVRSREGLRFAVFLRDVTEKREAHRALEESEDRLRRLVETSGLVPWVMDPASNRVTYVGPQAVDMMGYALASWREPGFLRETVHPDDVEAFDALIAEARRTGRGELEYRVLRAGGEVLWVRDILTLSTREDGRDRISGFRLDVTQRHELEEQLLRSQKMEAIGRLAGGVAHDFNNLMTAVLGNAALVKSSISPDHPVQEDLDEITRAGERAAELTQQLLAFARKQVVRPKLIDLQKTFDDTRRMLDRLIGDHITLETSVAPDTARVRVDPGRLEQVLVNLAVNARDAMPTGGSLIIEASNVELSGSQSGLEEIPPGAYVLIRVSDTGEGMSQAVLSQIWEPFFTTKAVGKGTGLGLATCQGIITQAGGQIRCYSEVGVGTTFKIYLPRAEAPVVDGCTEVEREAPSLAQGRGETVLVAEDEPYVLTLVTRVLREAGYQVLEARDGREAVSVARAHQGPLDLLVTDMVMPLANGETVADAIRSERSGVQVLYMTGYSEALASRIRQFPHRNDTLSKPFVPRDLLQRVREALDRGAAHHAGGPH